MNARNPLRPRSALMVCAVVVAALCPALHAQAAPRQCGPLTNNYGPFDYRTHREQIERVVEPYHFTPGVEALVRGQSTTKIAGDIGYLMRTSPNHHRGLLTLVRLAEREKSAQPTNLQYSIDCYFERASRFAPDDAIVRIIYAQYLQRRGRTKEAEQQLNTAAGYAGDNGFTHYNIGLAFFEMGRFERALEQAHEETKLGFDRRELADMLKRENRWKEPKE
jgi:tetratricopeptide (TPR) repeat protein